MGSVKTPARWRMSVALDKAQMVIVRTKTNPPRSYVDILVPRWPSRDPRFGLALETPKD